MPTVTSCPTCGSPEMAAFYEVRGVPVHSVLLMPTRAQAVGYPEGDICLAFCRRCGFVCNVAFDPERLEYSSHYEETQAFSPTFNSFHQRLAWRLIDRYGLRGKEVVEIGCGKGEFLTLLCELGDNRGLGFDPSHDADRTVGAANRRVTFVHDFYSDRYSVGNADLVCCKMTLEHIQPTAEFVQGIRRSIGNRFDTVVFFQVPNFMRVLRQLAFWDVYYEHCSYFTRASLARLFRHCNFQVLQLWEDYDDQYLMIEARPSDVQPDLPSNADDDLQVLEKRIAYFVENCAQRLEEWRAKLGEIAQRGRRVVLWGAGSKAVAFLTTLDLQTGVEYAVDINPHKQGTYLPGGGQEIVAPDHLIDYRPDVVIVMNAIYRSEIEHDLQRMGLAPEVLTVSA